MSATKYVDNLKIHPEFLKRLDGILSQLIPIVEHDANEIWLFGSVARGDYNGLSDLDFLVIIDTNETKERKALSMKIELADLREDVGFIPVDIIVRTQKYMYSDEFFPREVRRDKKLLWRANDV